MFEKHKLLSSKGCPYKFHEKSNQSTLIHFDNRLYYLVLISLKICSSYLLLNIVIFHIKKC